MSSPLLIRPESPSDVQTIHDLTAAAFASLEVSDHTEQFVIDALRESGALSLSLVAELDGALVGHIAFSPITLSDGRTDWYGAGPLSVLPELQRQGIGSALMWAGLEQLKATGARGCCLVGHPGYYERFGFIHPAGLGMEGVPPEVFFALAFDGNHPSGTLAFHPAFFASRDQNG